MKILSELLCTGDQVQDQERHLIQRSLAPCPSQALWAGKAQEGAGDWWHAAGPQVCSPHGRRGAFSSSVLQWAWLLCLNKLQIWQLIFNAYAVLPSFDDCRLDPWADDCKYQKLSEDLKLIYLHSSANFASTLHCLTQSRMITTSSMLRSPHSACWALSFQMANITTAAISHSLCTLYGCVSKYFASALSMSCDAGDWWRTGVNLPEGLPEAEDWEGSWHSHRPSQGSQAAWLGACWRVKASQASGCLGCAFGSRHGAYSAN